MREVPRTTFLERLAGHSPWVIHGESDEGTRAPRLFGEGEVRRGYLRDQGGPLVALSRELGITAATLSDRRDRFLAGAEAKITSDEAEFEEPAALQLPRGPSSTFVLNPSRSEIERVSGEVSPSRNIRFGISPVAGLAGAVRSSVYFGRGSV